MLDASDERNKQLEAWAASGSTGASAKCIAAHLAGFGKVDGSYPLDAGDFGRCERLLEMVPSLRADFAAMATVNAYWFQLAHKWEQIKSASDRTAAIRAIVRPIEDADPGHVRLSDTASARFVDLSNASPRMKETEADREVSDKAYRVAAGELRSFIERFERLEAEKKDIADAQKEVMAEAKARGYDTRVMRKVIALRKRDRDDIAEEEAVLEMYKSALGM